MDIKKFIRKIILESFSDRIVYYGTSKPMVYGIQKNGGVYDNKFNFTQDFQTAKYIAFVKSGKHKGTILRTKLNSEYFVPSKKYENGWTNIKQIPLSEIEIETNTGWIPLSNYDIYKKSIIN
jgi:hypothetical protein